MIAAIITVLTAAGILLLLSYLGRNSNPHYEQANGDESVYTKSADLTQKSGLQSETESAVEEDKNDDYELKGNFASYYLVKYDKDRISVYFSDQTGRITELEETTIVYETLSEEDQKRFEDGIKLDSRNDLNRLLMDYES